MNGGKVFREHVESVRSCHVVKMLDGTTINARLEFDNHSSKGKTDCIWDKNINVLISGSICGGT